ncbi:MAG: hypothetical protein V4617_17475 [Gemmatimonadota bacterium]
MKLLPCARKWLLYTAEQWPALSSTNLVQPMTSIVPQPAWLLFTLLMIGRAGYSTARVTEGPANGRLLPVILNSDSAIGEIVFQRSDGEGNVEIFTVAADGSSLRRLTTSPGFDGEPRWSPDGQRIVFTSDRDATPRQRASRDAAGLELYVMNADGTEVRRLTTNDHYDASPAWSPDGRRIALVATPGVRADSAPAGWAAQRQIHVMNVDGTGLQRLTASPGGNDYPAWSPEGRFIAFSSGRDGAGGAQIYLMNADGSDQMRLTYSAAEETYPVWSVDGRQIAFSKGRDSLSDVHVMEADGSYARQITRSAGFDGFPAWSSDGKMLVYARHLEPGAAPSLHVLDVAGAQPPRPIGVEGTRPSWRPGSR